jgi:hypothetical protein
MWHQELGTWGWAPGITNSCFSTEVVGGGEFKYDIFDTL